jgi:hypothetical protein
MVSCAENRLEQSRGDRVINVSIPYIYDFSASVKPLHTLVADQPIKDSIYILFAAENALNGFLTNSVYSESLRATRAPGLKLLAALRELTGGDTERNFTFFDTYNLSSLLGEFETVLRAEMNVGHCYLVTKTRGFDTATLITSAEELFSPQVATLFPEAIDDIRYAGRCIAFELATAAGFHIMRAAELVVRSYWDAVTNGATRPTRFNLGDYIQQMELKNVGSKKVLATLRQIKDLHRNELMHPEVALELDEAIALVNIVHSAINYIVKEIPGSQPTLSGVSAV